MDTPPIPLLFLDEASRHAAHALRLHRFAYRPHSFPHPSSPPALPEDLAPKPAHASRRRLPWELLQACLHGLPPGPMVVTALADTTLLQRLLTHLDGLTKRDRQVHLILGPWAQHQLKPSLARIETQVRSLILLPDDVPDSSLALCLEDLHLWLRSEASRALEGPWIWQGTPADTESIGTLASHLAALLSRHHPNRQEEALARIVGTETRRPLLAAHLPLDEEPELQDSLRRRGWDVFPLATGRSCPERLRHSLRLGAFLPLFEISCEEESDED